MSDLGLDSSFGNHEQIIVQVVDCGGESVFSVLNLSDGLMWPDLLINLWNRAIFSQEKFVCEAVSMAIRSVNPSIKEPDFGAFALRRLSRHSDFCFFRFFLNKLLFYINRKIVMLCLAQIPLF